MKIERIYKGGGWSWESKRRPQVGGQFNPHYLQRPYVYLYSITDDLDHIGVALGFGEGTCDPVIEFYFPRRLPRRLVQRRVTAICHALTNRGYGP